MNLGATVLYTQREGEMPIPAIVTRVWSDGGFGLYLLSHDFTTSVRSAHPSQIEALVDPDQLREIIEEFSGLGQRLSEIESELEFLRRMIKSDQAPAEQKDAALEEPKGKTLADVFDSDEPELESVESTRPSATAGKRKAAWPR